MVVNIDNGMYWIQNKKRKNVIVVVQEKDYV